MEGFKMRLIFFVCIVWVSMFADTNPTSRDVNNSVVKDEYTGLVEVKDASGVSEEQLRKKANLLDKNTQTVISEKTWEQLSPKAEEFDWVQTTSGEWFKGRIIGFYNERLEFDSKEIDEYTFKTKDIKQIKSHAPLSVNIENIASFEGIVRYNDGVLKVIQGDHVYDFTMKDVVSMAPSANKERDYWSGKISVSLDARSGNVDQYDYSTIGNLKRRTSDSVLAFDYIGRVSSKDGALSASNQRLNEKYDIYQTRYFFWTPLVSEYYTDRFRNIKKQITAGVGAGYTLFKEGDNEWKVSGSPSVIYTKYESVSIGEKQSNFTGALGLSTNLEYEFNTVTTVKYSYQLNLTDKFAGKYTHHMVTTLENELLSWLDLDVSFIWDYILEPQSTIDKQTPKKSDFQLLVGLGIEF